MAWENPATQTTGTLITAALYNTLVNSIQFLGAITNGGESALSSLTNFPGLPFIHIQDQKSAGTDGGGSSATTWNKRTLNTEVTDTDGLSALSSDQITLDAGTYYIEATAPYYGAGSSKLRLRNTTGAATLLVGTPGREDVINGTVMSPLAGRFTVAASQALELQHYSDTAHASDGLGKATGGSEIEVYADVRIWKISD